MFQLPQHYIVSADASSDLAKTWVTHSREFIPLTCAVPTEFGGPGGGVSPEEIYAMALANCFIATFKVIAQASRLAFGELHVSADLTVDQSPDGPLPWMAAIYLIATLNGTNDETKARRLLEKASKSCMILNSVKTAKTFEFVIAPQP